MTVLDVLQTTGFSYASEVELHEQIAIAFDHYGIEYQREVVLGPKDRIDFIVGKIGIEVKIAGAMTKAASQLLRYSEHDEIDELILFTTRASHNWDMKSANGKPVTIVKVQVAL